MTDFISPRLRGLKPYEPGEQPTGADNLIKLNTNESPFPPSPKVVEAVAAAATGLQLYCDPECGKLRAAVAKRYGLPPDMVLPANGSDEALALITHGCCPNGAVFADVTYGFYATLCGLFHVPFETVPLRGDFTLNVSDYAGRAGTVFVANPNAPTGLLLGLAGIEELLNQDKRRLVVADEAYIDFGGESAAGLVERYDNLLVTQTFSKSRALAGARVGFALGNAALIADLNALRYSFNPYDVNAMSQAAAVAAMDDAAYFEACRAEVIDTRDCAADELRRAGFTVTESRANFLFVKHPRLGGLEYFKRLREGGVLARYFGGERTRDFVRITVGTREQMERVVNISKGF